MRTISKQLHGDWILCGKKQNNCRQKPVTDYTVKEICKLLGASKQAYYKHDDNAAMRRLAQEEFARQYITETRGQAPGMGGVKIWEMYIKEFGTENAIGRDRFCDIYEAMGA